MFPCSDRTAKTLAGHYKTGQLFSWANRHKLKGISLICHYICQENDCTYYGKQIEEGSREIALLDSLTEQYGKLTNEEIILFLRETGYERVVTGQPLTMDRVFHRVVSELEAGDASVPEAKLSMLQEIEKFEYRTKDGLKLENDLMWVMVYVRFNITAVPPIDGPCHKQLVIQSLRRNMDKSQDPS